MIGFDLKSPTNFGHNTFTDSLKGPANVYRTGLYTMFYPHYGWKSPRCKHPRRPDFSTWSNLHHGSRLPRLCPSLQIHSKPFSFYYKSQKQLRLSPSLLSQGRQNNWPSIRPDDKAQWFLCITGLSCYSSPHQLLRYRDEEKIRFFNQQFCYAGFDNCSALQVPTADRNFFQMEQAILANQNIFWHYRERCEDSNLDCHRRLRSSSDCQEGIANRDEFGRNPANSQHCPFRKSSYYTSTYEKSFAKRKFSIS